MNFAISTNLDLNYSLKEIYQQFLKTNIDLKNKILIILNFNNQYNYKKLNKKIQKTFPLSEIIIINSTKIIINKRLINQGMVIFYIENDSNMVKPFTVSNLNKNIEDLKLDLQNQISENLSNYRYFIISNNDDNQTQILIKNLTINRVITSIKGLILPNSKNDYLLFKGTTISNGIIGLAVNKNFKTTSIFINKLFLPISQFYSNYSVDNNTINSFANYNAIYPYQQFFSNINNTNILNYTKNYPLMIDGNVWQPFEATSTKLTGNLNINKDKKIAIATTTKKHVIKVIKDKILNFKFSNFVLVIVNNMIWDLFSGDYDSFASLFLNLKTKSNIIIVPSNAEIDHYDSSDIQTGIYNGTISIINL